MPPGRRPRRPRTKDGIHTLGEAQLVLGIHEKSKTHGIFESIQLSSRHVYLFDLSRPPSNGRNCRLASGPSQHKVSWRENAEKSDEIRRCSTTCSPGRVRRLRCHLVRPHSRQHPHRPAKFDPLRPDVVGQFGPDLEQLAAMLKIGLSFGRLRATLVNLGPKLAELGEYLPEQRAKFGGHLATPFNVGPDLAQMRSDVLRASYAASGDRQTCVRRSMLILHWRRFA